MAAPNPQKYSTYTSGGLWGYRIYDSTFATLYDSSNVFATQALARDDLYTKFGTMEFSEWFQVYRQDDAPAVPDTFALWEDTSPNPTQLYVTLSGSAGTRQWVLLSVIQSVEGANKPLLRVVSGVSGATSFNTATVALFEDITPSMVINAAAGHTGTITFYQADDQIASIQAGGDATYPSMTFRVSGSGSAALQIDNVAGANATTIDGTLSAKCLDSAFYVIDDSDNTKKLQFQCSSITTATTRTLTVPDASTTIVGTDVTQTLTNKTLTDSTNTFADNGDATKKFAFQCSGISTATTRTATVPNSDFIMVGSDRNETITGTWTFTPRTTHTGGLSLSTSGNMQSTVADGASAVAFDLQDTIARTQGTSFQLRNSNAGVNLMASTFDGHFTFGYSASGDSGAVLAFDVSDASTPTGGTSNDTGIIAITRHANTAVTLTPSLTGIIGCGAGSTTTGLSGSAIVGLQGTASYNTDSTGLTAKYLIGVRAVNIGNASASIVRAAIDPTGSTATMPKGNWAMEASFFADYIAQTTGLATNRPLLSVAARLPIKGWSATAANSGEQWGIYGEAPTTGSPTTPAVGGYIRIPFPARGTRKTHMYIVPTAAAAANPTGNIKGDVYFDDGTNNAVGLWEHNGTAWKKLLPLPTAPAAYTPTNATTDRSWDCNSTSIDELADILATLVADLQALKIIG